MKWNKQNPNTKMVDSNPNITITALNENHIKFKLKAIYCRTGFKKKNKKKYLLFIRNQLNI